MIEIPFIFVRTINHSTHRMFATAFLALFVCTICNNAVECFTVRRPIFSPDVALRTETAKNFTILKRIDDVAIENQPVPFSILRDADRIVISKKNVTDLGGKKESQHRRPKFFGPLSFLAGLGAGSLASANANAFAKLFNSAFTLQFGPSGYFAGLYSPQPYVPVSYPVFYPVPTPLHHKPNVMSGIPVIAPPGLFADSETSQQQISNLTISTGKNSNRTNTDSSNKDLEVENQTNDEVDPISPIISDDEPESRQIFGSRSTTTTTSATSNTTTTTSKPMTTTPMNTSSINVTVASNETLPTELPANTTTESPSFHGYYYGSNPQYVGNVILTTENPEQRYYEDHVEETYPLPFERAAIFNPYHNFESYSNPFSNSFSSNDQFADFLNTIESEPYRTDEPIDNRWNSNGFRPIL
ncbi:uncharacterized protein LOC125502221 [Athalia rosae]|uniref:uncharacterized protein LOC125502221 n=1 Tax=Athalia rosae TaxID=37344 RepID=UPI002034436B|nr:uncharacterized protein LOC125502221 [Athalia rosae]